MDFMFLNVRRAPFDDLQVRRALNYATDRERIVELSGGPQVAAPTCQIVPPGLPGYVPYCPFGATPDLERAQHLVAESGRAGQRVVVTVPLSKRQVGRYFVGVLKDLGFRASLHVAGSDSAYLAEIEAPGSTAQIGYSGWSADYLTASSFIQPNFACAPNPPHICDATLTRQIERARLAQGAEAAKLWAAADRRLVDLAAAVPLTSSRELVFVSKRVGNLQSHPQWGTLLDQLWVR
jgi:peptide/nickel transport system substrate-binding protein